MRFFNFWGLLIMCVFSLNSLFSQQNAEYMQYMYNMNIVNPAYVGSTGMISMTLLGSTKWVGIEGAPMTSTLSVHSPINKDIGAGVSMVYDKIGATTQSSFYLDGSYTIDLSSEHKMSFGLKLGFTSLAVKPLVFEDVENRGYIIEYKQFNPAFGTGIYLYSEKYYIGLSVPNLLSTKYIDKSKGVIYASSQKANYYATLGYVYDMSSSLKIKPSAMASFQEGTPLLLDLSLNIMFNERVEIGGSHRLRESINGVFGYYVSPSFKIGYAYGYSITSLGAYSGGSHEFIMAYDFNKVKVLNP
ncbi:MAG: type IX secretion system membrane protein PorP/SprF, partial [Flavobacteriaceae bacterium]|nr:type IX secretion system membrane protein PorP/SprF [Flavobacteriaceae bacterium]